MNKKINILHGSALLLYEMYAGLAYSFGSYILIEKGFSSTVAGIIMSLGNIVGFILQPIISNITDNSKKITIIHVLIIETAFSFVACVLNVFTQSPTISAAISFVVILAAASLLEALYNSVHFILNDNGYNVDDIDKGMKKGSFLDKLGDSIGSWGKEKTGATDEQGSAFGTAVITSFTSKMGEAGEVVGKLAQNMASMGPLLGAIATALEYVFEGLNEVIGGELKEQIEYGLGDVKYLFDLKKSLQKEVQKN